MLDVLIYLIANGPVTYNIRLEFVSLNNCYFCECRIKVWLLIFLFPTITVLQMSFTHDSSRLVWSRQK